MNTFLHLKKLHQNGFDHVLLGVAFAVVIGVAGSYYLLATQAAPWSGGLEVQSTASGGYCLDQGSSPGNGSRVFLSKCTGNTVNQKWQLMKAGTYNGKTAYTVQIYRAGSPFLCIDDWQASKVIGRNNQARLYDCNGVDAAQRFVWWGSGNHQLYNVASGHCLDDVTSINVADFYTCKTSSQGNQQWFEVGNSASSGSNPSSGGSGNGNGNGNGGSGTPGTGTPGTIKASVGTNMCVAASGNTVVLQTCNSSTVGQQWTQVASAKGSSSREYINQASHEYLAAANQNSGTKVTLMGGAAINSTIWSTYGSSGLMIGVFSGNPCLDAPSDSSGTQLVLADCNGSSNQSFTFPPSATLSGGSSTTAFASSTTAATGSSTTAPSGGTAQGAPVSQAAPSNDFTNVLRALKSRNIQVNCNAFVNSADISSCKSIYRE